VASVPQLESVLANVCRGRVAYVALTPEQNRMLRDPDGRIALDVLRHLLGARPLAPERFPLTEQAFQSVARRLGYVVGQKRCRGMTKRLLASGARREVDVSLEGAQAILAALVLMAGERKGNAAYALADLLSWRGQERPCENLSRGRERRRTARVMRRFFGVGIHERSDTSLLVT
jgi:hypothetical protein